MWNGSEVKPAGTARITICNPPKSKIYSVKFIVVSDTLTPLIRARAAQQMKLITVSDDNFTIVTPLAKASQLEIK